MTLFNKSLAVTLALFVGLFTGVPAGPIAFADATAYHETADGNLVPTKPVPEAESEADEVEAVQEDELVTFLSKSPLSDAENDAPKATSDQDSENAEESYYDFSLSDDPFYPTSGSWGQSYDDLWWLKRVNADDAWSISRGSGVTVAVVDTGIDYNHEDLAGNIWYNDAELNGLSGVDDDGDGFIDNVSGWDFQNNDNDALDDNGHGSHVAGIIGGIADNMKGIAGIAPESKIMAVKVLDSGGSGTIQNVMDGIRYAADKGADVINLSLGVMKNFLSKSLQRAFSAVVQYATDLGSIVVAAAGNNGSNVNNQYPAAIANVIAVGAMEPVTDDKAYFSNFGSALDFIAPGVDVLSVRAGGSGFGSNSSDPKYSRASGTSMASPIVAGVVALLKSWNPLLTLGDVYRRLRLSAEDLGDAGFDNNFGWGLVDAYGALTVVDDGSDPGSGGGSGGGGGKKDNPPGGGKGGGNAAIMSMTSMSLPVPQAVVEQVAVEIPQEKVSPSFNFSERSFKERINLRQARDKRRNDNKPRIEKETQSPVSFEPAVQPESNSVSYSDLLNPWSFVANVTLQAADMGGLAPAPLSPNMDQPLS
ncbi:MAG: S8 family peptidase [Candidatus Omnitrophota bacterium]|nr:S8 family peptidase [Candidatus Omnitrophota bacterium]